MIRSVSFFSDSLPTTALGYGTTSLLGVETTAARLTLLESAYDAGVRHFDTAPYYGYGEAERVLGEFLVKLRDQVTVTTKFGIQPPAMVKGRVINLLARRILQWFPFLRAAVSRKAQSMSKKRAFAPAEARRSLEQSLAALRTDHVDLLLLHEPTLEDVNSEPLLTFLHDEMQQGRIRAFGCGADYRTLRTIAEVKPNVSRYLQFEDHIDGKGIIEGRRTGARCITFRTFQRVLPMVEYWLREDESRIESWSRALDVNLKARGILADILQALSHYRNPDGILLFSSRNLGRIRRAAEIAEGDSFSQEQLKTLDSYIKASANQIRAVGTEC